MGKSKLSYLGVLSAVLFLLGGVVGGSVLADNDWAGYSITVVPPQGGYVYSGAEIEPSGAAVVLKDDGGNVVAGGYTLSYEANVNAGTAKIFAVPSSTPGDNKAEGAFTIAKASIAAKADFERFFSFTAGSATYDGASKALNPETAITPVGGVTGAGAFTLSYKQGAAAVSAPTAAGDYDVSVTMAAGANFNAVTAGVSVGTLAIGKAAFAVGVTVDTSAVLKAWLDTVRAGIVSVNSSGALVPKAAPTGDGLVAKSPCTGVAAGTGQVKTYWKLKNGGTIGTTADYDVPLDAAPADSGRYMLKITAAEGSNIFGGSAVFLFALSYAKPVSSPLNITARSAEFTMSNIYTVAWPTITNEAFFGKLDSIYNVRAEFAAAVSDFMGLDNTKPNGFSDDAFVVDPKKITRTNTNASKTVTFSLVHEPGAVNAISNGKGFVRLHFSAKGKSADGKRAWLWESDSMLVEIAPKALEAGYINLTDYPIVYTGSGIGDEELSNKFVVIHEGMLNRGADYVIVPYWDGANPAVQPAGSTTLNRRDAGANKAWLVIRGVNNYSGEAQKQFTIERAPITASVSVVNGPKVYSGKADIDTNWKMANADGALVDNAKPYAKVTFGGVPSPSFANGVDYEIRSARYSDSTAGAVCSLTVRVALKNTANAQNFKFAGASADSVVVKAYGLPIAKLTADTSKFAFIIPTNHYYNGTQRGIAAPTLKAPLALGGGGALTTTYKYAAGTLKPDFDTTVAVLGADKDTSYAPKKAGSYAVSLKVTGSANLEDVTLPLGDYVIKAPAGPEIAFPAAGSEGLSLLIRQGRSVSLKVSAKSPNGGALSYKWHTVEALGGVTDSARPMNVAGLVTTDSVLTITVGGAVGTSAKYKALVTNTAPAGVQDPRAVTAWTETFTVTVDDPPSSIVGAKVTVDSAKEWEYTGYPLTPSGDDVKVFLPGAVTGADTAWDAQVEADQYTLSYAANTNAGTATVRATAISTGKYQGTASTTFEIARKRFATTDIAYTEERTYTGDTLGAQVRANPPMTGMGALSVRYGASAEAPVNAGDYDVYVSAAGGDNVSSSDGFQYLGAYTIKKLAADTAKLNYTKPGELNHVEGETEAFGIGEVTLKVKGYTGTLDVLYDGVDEAPVTAGVYTVTVELGGDDNVEAGFVALGSYTIKAKPDAVAQGNREVPNKAVFVEAVVAPVKAGAAAGAFTAGPNPVSKNGGKIAFFSAKAVKGGSLYVFDAAGNAAAKLAVKAGSGEIGSWNLKDGRGVAVSEGVYVVKGALVGKDGTREKVSFVFSVVR